MWSSLKNNLPYQCLFLLTQYLTTSMLLYINDYRDLFWQYTSSDLQDITFFKDRLISFLSILPNHAVKGFIFHQCSDLVGSYRSCFKVWNRMYLKTMPLTAMVQIKCHDQGYRQGEIICPIIQLRA